jgi:hypothetical protein
MGEGRNLYRVLVGKPEGKRPLERASYRREDGIRMELRESRYEVRVLTRLVSCAVQRIAGP